MKRLIAGAISMFALILMAVPVMADQVTRTQIPISASFTVSGVCPFDVRVDLLGTEVTKTFVDNSGALVKEIDTAKLNATFTNLSTGKTVTANASGPGMTTFNADGSSTLKLRGPGVAFGPALMGTGQMVFEISPTGVSTLVKVVGNFQDSCQALA